jgi:hypothetical protein
MPIPAYAPEDLALFSTVICRAVSYMNWNEDISKSTRGPETQEVQCMQIKDGLFFAGNYAEHEGIAHLFMAFGVSNHASLIRLLRYCYRILMMSPSERSEKLGKGIQHQFSPTENITLGYAHESLTLLPPLTLLECQEIKNMVEATKLPTVPNPQMWFFRKFLGVTKKIPGLTKPTATSFNYAGNYSNTHEVNLILDGSAAHAELKLSWILASAYEKNAMTGPDRVALGGLKNTCLYCNAWLLHFRAWMLRVHDVRVSMPRNDQRVKAVGKGSRPKNIPQLQASTREFGKALFNGEANNECSDLTALEREAYW